MTQRSDANHPPPLSLRLRLMFELGTLAALTLVFLYYARQDLSLYVGMAALFLGFVAFSAKETRERIWGPPTSRKSDRLWRSTLAMAAMTIPGVIVFFAWCVWTGHEVSYVNLLLALGLYIPWALLQQTIFQFYLLGRLRALLPLASPILLAVVVGTAYGLVHLPDWHVALVTIAAGIFWSYSYLRDRHILPIAISHAILGSTFYYFVMARDLIDEHLGHFSNWV